MAASYQPKLVTSTLPFGNADSENWALGERPIPGRGRARHLRRTLITRVRIEGCLLDDHEREYETAIAALLSWYKQGFLQTREDVKASFTTLR